MYCVPRFVCVRTLLLKKFSLTLPLRPLATALSDHRSRLLIVRVICTAASDLPNVACPHTQTVRLHAHLTHTVRKMCGHTLPFTLLTRVLTRVHTCTSRRPLHACVRTHAYVHTRTHFRSGAANAGVGEDDDAALARMLQEEELARCVCVCVCVFWRGGGSVYDGVCMSPFCQ